jgi:hypothetical protein
LHVLCLGYGDGASICKNGKTKTPPPGLAMGFDKTFECQSEPDRRAA